MWQHPSRATQDLPAPPPDKRLCVTGSCDTPRAVLEKALRMIADRVTSNPSILIVDDDLPLLEALERAFKEANQQQVVALASFQDAKSALRARHFDVLITDVRLGAFNGLQLAGLAREIHPDIRLIVFSGFDDPVLRQDAERLGGVYLVKPVTSSYLLTLIQ
jgi:DNA-binding NtrC family response regulator